MYMYTDPGGWQLHPGNSYNDLSDRYWYRAGLQRYFLLDIRIGISFTHDGIKLIDIDQLVHMHDTKGFIHDRKG